MDGKFAAKNIFLIANNFKEMIFIYANQCIKFRRHESKWVVNSATRFNSMHFFLRISYNPVGLHLATINYCEQVSVLSDTSDWSWFMTRGTAVGGVNRWLNDDGSDVSTAEA